MSRPPVRGSDRGGDWSATFVRNSFRTDQVIDRTFSFENFLPPDFTASETVTDGSVFTVPGEVEVFGIKFEKFTPFVTIQDRVQIGLTYGGSLEPGPDRPNRSDKRPRGQRPGPGVQRGNH